MENTHKQPPLDSPVRNLLRQVSVGVKLHQRDTLLAFTMVLVAWSAYSLGRIQGAHQEPVAIRPANGQEGQGADQAVRTPAQVDTRVVISKNSSSGKYHYSWCSGAKRIKEENKVWFQTATAAETAGYSLAGNCR